jgi:transposase
MRCPTARYTTPGDTIHFFCKLKQFRAIATRYDKTARNFLAGIHCAAALILLN